MQQLKVNIMSKYAQRSATQRRRYIERLVALCLERGVTFIALDVVEGKKSSNYYMYFEKDGEICRQYTKSFKNGVRLQSEYLNEIKRWPEGQGIYKFYAGEELVYLGKTSNFNLRFQGHFKTYRNPEHHTTTISKNKDLIDRIEFCCLGESDMNIYEMYLLAKYKPRFNDKDVPKDVPSFELPDLEFTELTGWR